MSAGAGPGAAVHILAPAKINLGLEILGRRPDGYHELRTIFQAIDFSDRVRIARTPSGLHVRCRALPRLGRRNLAYRAAKLFFGRTGLRESAEIHVEKRIPAGGGLGGGSSDAAAVLLGCCRLYGLRPERRALASMAAALGSDVPFFLEGGTAVGRGRGELIEPLAPWPGQAVALLYLPTAGLATADVYGRVASPPLTARPRALTILLARWREGDLARLGKALFNDLEEAAFSLRPELATVKEALLREGAAGALLSGSGSSVFGLYENEAAAGRAGRRLGERFPGRFVKARLLSARRRWGVVKR